MNLFYKNCAFTIGALLAFSAFSSFAHAAPGFANDICRASSEDNAKAAVLQRARFMVDIMWDDHLDTLLRMGGLQDRQANGEDPGSPAMTPKLQHAAISGLLRAAGEAFAGNDDMSISVGYGPGEGSDETPTVVLDCSNSTGSQMTRYSFPIDAPCLFAMITNNDADSIDVSVIHGR